MPPRPFPYQLSIGTDIINVARIRQLLRNENIEDRTALLQRYLRRFLTYREINAFYTRFETPANIFGRAFGDATRYLGGRWAAKEAAIKAVTWRKLSFKHVQILRRDDQTKSGTMYALILDKPGSAFGPAVGSMASAVRRLKLQNDSTAQQGEDQVKPTSNDPVGQWIKEDEPDSLAPSKPKRRASAQDDEFSEFIPGEQQDDDVPGQIAKISISHDGDFATAVCLAAEEPRVGDVGGEAAAREPW